MFSRCSLSGETSKQSRLECSSTRETMNLLMSRSRNNEFSKAFIYSFWARERKRMTRKTDRKRTALRARGGGTSIPPSFRAPRPHGQGRMGVPS